MREQRRLAAIMFTDIVGYSALMSKDEKVALQILNRNRELQKSALSRFHGEFIKEIGDGTLSIFQSSWDAVSCAMELQNTLNEAAYYQLRIGIHIGDIVISEKDVFGDGVNIASRIQALCEPGSILISETVYNEIINKSGIKGDCIGEKLLKNIDKPIKIYAIAAECFKRVSEQQISKENQSKQAKGWLKIRHRVSIRNRTIGIAAVIILAMIIAGGYFIFSKKQRTPTRDEERSALIDSRQVWTNSIAVLPFTDLSPEKDQEYFCDGMAEELINVLSYIPELKVVARTSAFVFKGKETDVRDIGQKLNVKTILEGSVRKSGNHLRISAQLIDVNNGYHLWSQTYDRELKDVFAIQDEISNAIVNALKTRILPEEKGQEATKQTKSTEAYDLYLKGRFLLNKRGEDIKKSVDFFEQALEVDPDYALAYAGLADAYFLLTWWDYIPRPGGYEKAKELAMQALELDRNLAEAYATLGGILCYGDWQWEESREIFKQAIELNPNNATAHQYYSELLDILCEYDEARKEIDLAMELDPVYFMYQLLSIRYYRNDGKWNEALDAISRYEDFFPEPNMYRNLFNVYMSMGDSSRAVDALQGMMARDTTTVKYVKNIREIYDKSGMKGALTFITDKMLQETSPSSLVRAQWFALAKEKEPALNWLEKAMEEHQSTIQRINTDPEYDFLRNEPRFLALIDQMGLTSYNKRASR